MSDIYSDSKINLVMNKVTKDQYQKLQISNLIEEDQLYMITDDGSTISGDSRYNLLSRELKLSSIILDGTATDCLTCQVDDLAITTVQVSSDSYPVIIYLPTMPDSGARDFCVRVECLSSSVPSIAFMGSGSESCDFESENDEWATLEVGANLFNFTETKR